MIHKVLLTGDSQLAALLRGYRSLADKGLVPPNIDISIIPMGAGVLMTKPFYVERNGVAEIVEEVFRKRIRSLPLPGAKRAYGFCANLHTVRLLRDGQWDRFAPAELAQKEYPLSAGIVERAFYDDQKYMLGLLDVLLAAGERVFVIEAPHLFRHHPVVQTVRKDVLQYLNREYRAYVRGQLERRGIPVVSVPPSCIDEDGFMLARYRHENERDKHHGNAEFGELMMAEVFAMLESWLPDQGDQAMAESA